MSFAARFCRALAPTSLLLMTLLAGCARHDPAPAEPQVLTWTVDGQAMTTLSAQQIPHGPTGSTLEVNGAGAAAQGGYSVTLYLPKRVGTYALTPTNADVYAAYSGDGLYRSTSGSITVSSLTATAIKGTFFFTGTRDFGPVPQTKTITKGTFHVAL